MPHVKPTYTVTWSNVPEHTDYIKIPLDSEGRVQKRVSEEVPSNREYKGYTIKRDKNNPRYWFVNGMMFTSYELACAWLSSLARGSAREEAVNVMSLNNERIKCTDMI
jgi:hypothetical protein